MRRRDVLQAVALSATLPPMVMAQQSGPRSKAAKIGVLWQSDSVDAIQIYRDALLKAFSGLGYHESSTAHFIERSTADPRRLRELAAELVGARPDVIVAAAQLAATELKQATSTIPVVFATSLDPVGAGLVQSLARPGGNVTGFSGIVADTAGKRMQLFKEAVPSLRRLAILHDPREPRYQTNISSYEAPAKALALDLRLVEMPSPEAIVPTFSAIAKDGFDGAIVVGIMPLLARVRVGAAALAEKMPTASFAAEAVPHGLLMSYGLDFVEYFRRAPSYVDKILRGARPADLPVEQLTLLKLVINLKVARTLGLTIPPSVLVAADEIVE